MKKLKLLLLFLILSFHLQAQEIWKDRNRLLPDQLRGIETEILISHNPGLVTPILNTDSNIRGKYVWKHSTTVSTNYKNLEIVSAGSFIWTAKGWFANMNLSISDFENLFNCPNALLKAGKTYTYKDNFRFGNELYGGDALWFVIAKDKDGKLYKGIALVETESQLKNN